MVSGKLGVILKSFFIYKVGSKLSIAVRFSYRGTGSHGDNCSSMLWFSVFACLSDLGGGDSGLNFDLMDLGRAVCSAFYLLLGQGSNF